MIAAATRDAPDDAPRPEQGTPASGQASHSPLPIALILLGGLALRLLIAHIVWPGEGLVSDLRLFTLWADVLAQHGPGGFYGNAGFADYPPGYLYVLWVVGLVADALAGPLGVAPADIVGALVKVPAIAADFLVAILLYRAAAAGGASARASSRRRSSSSSPSPGTTRRSGPGGRGGGAPAAGAVLL